MKKPVLEDASNQELLQAWNTGNEAAARLLVHRYLTRLLALAKSRLSRTLGRRLDAEDIVFSVWRSFFVGVDQGRFETTSEDDLWPLLVTLTVRKLARQHERHHALLRNANLDISWDAAAEWREAISQDPSPDQAAILTEEVDALWSSLSETDQNILRLQLQGEKQADIAASLNCSKRTVRRSQQRIRDILIERGGISSDHFRHFLEAEKIQKGKPSAFRVLEGFKASEILLHYDYRDIVLQQMIGSGGFCKVYLATSKRDNSSFVVKYLRKKFWQNREARIRILQEASLISQLSHPNIVSLSGTGTTPSGVPFLVMERIVGVDLQEWILTDKPALADVLRCGIQIADALSAAHQANIIHGDLSPANVLRTADHQFMLTDFGFAQLNDASESNSSGGTPGFLAPEQVSHLFGSTGVKTDVYGLGGLLYFLLTGNPPTTGHSFEEVISNVISSQPIIVPPQDTNIEKQRLQELALWCLKKDPGQRPDSIEKVSEKLLSIQSDDRR
ncbi:MAG: protein kinase [Planctomycetaceae bacterium]|nr:protein kinase [Planctomycetaceae bacterium]